MEEKALSTIGKYQIIGTLGRGSMGVVYKARDPEIGRIVAVKTLRKIVSGSFQNEDAALQRFRTEARSAGNLRHPNVITVFEVNIEHEIPYIVMDYVDGESLDRILIRHSRLNHLLTLYYLKQIAAGLDAAHQKGVIHRDIKPSNIIVDQEENVYILDFGVASMNESFTDTGRPCKAEPVMGTPGYMSPEQILNKSLDHRTDLFSLGVVAFECFTGRRPFSGDTPSQVLSAILNDKPIPITSLVDLPLALEAEFERALDKERERRFESAETMVSAMAKALGVDRIDKPVFSAAPGEERGPIRQRKISEWKSLARPAGMAVQKQAGFDKYSELPMFYPADDASMKSGNDKEDLTNVCGREGWGSGLGQGEYHPSVPGEIFAHVNDSLSGGRVLNPLRGRFYRLVAAGLLLLIVLSTTVIWKGLRSVEDGSQAAAGQSLYNQSRAVSIETELDWSQIPSGAPPSLSKTPGELSDSELLAVLVDSGTDDARLLAALHEAENRRLGGLLEATAYTLQSDSYVVRIESIKLLKRLGDKRAVPLLIAVLDDHDPAVRGWAAVALGSLGSRRALGYLSSRLAREPVDQVKTVLRRSIEKINGFPMSSEEQR